MQTLPRSLKIGVIRGGPSVEYDASLKTGVNVLKHLSETHNPVDIFISKDGKWHLQGIERSPERILKNVDVVFNALHGAYGEDGQVQEILNLNNIPYTGSGRYESAIAMNKWLTKEKIKSLGIKMPVSYLVRQTDQLEAKAKEIFSSLPHPLIVKPASHGSVAGSKKIDSYTELLSALENVLASHSSAIVEEYILGKGTSCIMLDNFRGQDIYAFPPTEHLLKEESDSVEDISKKIHQLMNLSHYSQSSFIVSPKRGVYFLEVNTLPKISDESALLKSLESVGVSVKDFLHHVIGLAMEKK